MYAYLWIIFILAMILWLANEFKNAIEIDDHGNIVKYTDNKKQFLTYYYQYHNSFKIIAFVIAFFIVISILIELLN